MLKNRGFMGALFILIAFLMQSVAFAADTNTTVTPSTPQSIVPSPPTLDAKGFILMDANTGKVLAGNNIDTQMPPASLTKLMTLYQIAQALQSNRLHLQDKILISEKAWRTGGSKMFLQVGDHVPLDSLIQGIAVVSGNDACVAVAEHLAGTEEAFSDLMNHSASLLGMTNTHYTDATGLPNPKHITSPRDLALLTRAIVNQFPQYYHWYSQKSFEYNGIKQPNRDILLFRDPSIEGMKTGHTDEAGYCLVSTASRNGMRLISVVMGAPSPNSRAESSLALLNYGFRFFESKKLYAANAPLKESRVWFGNTKNLPIGVKNGVYLTAPTGQLGKLKTELTVNNNLQAPIKKGTEVGQLTLKLDDQVYLSEPLVALTDVPRGGIFSRTKDFVVLQAHKLIHRVI